MWRAAGRRRQEQRVEGTEQQQQDSRQQMAPRRSRHRATGAQEVEPVVKSVTQHQGQQQVEDPSRPHSTLQRLPLPAGTSPPTTGSSSGHGHMHQRAQPSRETQADQGTARAAPRRPPMASCGSPS